MEIKINIMKKHLYILTALIIIITATLFVMAAYDSSKASHGTLYVDTIEPKTGADIGIIDANVGIGTTSPYVSKLHVYSGSEDLNTLRVENDHTGYAPFVIVNPSGWGIYDTATKHYFAGNVGIGTTSPTTMLEVAQNNAIKLGNAYLSSGEGYAHLATNEWYDGNSWQQSGDGALIQIWGQKTVFYRHTDGGHYHSMTIDSNGNVGIGTTSPSEKLEVSGNVKVTGTVSGLSKSIVYKTCSASGNNYASCTANCPSGYKVIGGGCSASGSVTAYNQVFSNNPTGSYTGWYCRTTVDWDRGGTMKATGYAICLKQ